MKKIVTLIGFILLICFTPLTLSLPTEEEPLKSVKNMAPVMQTLLSDIARELISRSASSNQVLTLNMTNLLILLVLKGLLWGASYAGATGYHKARSEDENPEPMITETEILLLLSYLMGDEDNNFECLHRIACEDPFKAQEYTNAGKIVINAAKFIGLNSANNHKYEEMLDKLEEAVKFKESGGKCETKYTCNQENENTIL